MPSCLTYSQVAVFWLVLQGLPAITQETQFGRIGSPTYLWKWTQEKCSDALGLSDGRIKDGQINVPSAFNDDFKTFGPQRARLNLTTWPPGYRSNPAEAEKSWIQVDVGHVMAVTEVATQGYGGEDAMEWVIQYMLLYTTDSDYVFFRNIDESVQLFTGNVDPNTIQRNSIVLPQKARSVMLMPVTWFNNVAFRLELYGCEPGYYFVVWLMVDNSPFTRDFLDDEHEHTRLIKEDVIHQVTETLKNVPGFLDAFILTFSPQATEASGPLLTAEVEIECLRASESHLITKLQDAVASGKTIFYEKQFQLQYTADEVGSLLNFTLNLNETAEESVELIPDEPFTVKAQVSSSLNSTVLLEKFDFSWQMSTVDGKTGQFSPFVGLVGNTMNITVSSKELFVGLTYVRVFSKPKGVNGTVAYDFGFLRFLPPLVPTIVGPQEGIKGGGLVQLTSTVSGELKGALASGRPITYSWSCEVEEDTSPQDISLHNKTKPENNSLHDYLHNKTKPENGYLHGYIHNKTKLENDSLHFFLHNKTKPENISLHAYLHNKTKPDNESFVEPVNKTRCFVHGSELSSEETFISIDPDNMIANRTYIFHLNVTQGRRVVVASHRLRIDTNMSFSLTCAVNCEHKVSTRRKMAIESRCVGVSCSEIKRYQWSLFVEVQVSNSSNSSWSKVEDLEDRITTSMHGPNLVFTGGITHNQSSLMGNKTYKVHAAAWVDEDNYEEATYIFHTNIPPYKKSKDAGCFVHPTEGEAITTKFHVECANWTDADLPLTYQFAYLSDFGVVVFHTGIYTNASTELPMGKPENDYVVLLQLDVIDSLHDAAVEMLMVTVRPSKDLEGAKGRMDDLFSSGDIGSAMQMAFALLSSDTGGSSMKSGLLDKMENMEVTNLEQATLVVGVLALATDGDDGISGESQDKALKLLGSSINFLSSQMGNGSVDPDLVKSVGTSLFSGIGNVLDSASAGAGTGTEESEEEEEEEGDSEAEKAKSKQRAQNALNLVSQVGNSLLATKTVGEKPTVFKTKSMAVLLDRQLSSDMGGKKLGEGSSGVSLPSASSLFNDSSSAVDSQMMAFNKNPFTWDKSAATVKSSVLEFKLKVPGGDVMEVSGLAEPIELFIPLPKKKKKAPEKETNGSADGGNLFLKPSDGTSNIRYHRFSISSPDVLVTIQIKPELGRTLDIFVNYMTRPTPENNNFSMVLPDWSSCTNITEHSLDHNCTSDPYTFSVSSLVTGHTGPHYLGVRYTPIEPEQDDSKRTKRSCGPHKRRGKRSCVNVKDAPTTPAPIPQIIMPVYNSTTDTNYTLSISISGCLYWSESKEKWTGEGCRVGPETNSERLQCLCTHLSAFGGDFLVAPNPIDFDKVFAAFGNLAESGNFVVLSTVCVLLGLYVIGLILARREDKKDELRVVANVYLNDNEADHKYYISVQTGMWRGNGTSANVGILIQGSDSSTDAIPLTDPELEKQFFARGSINNFTLSLPEALGTIEKICIWHDNSGGSPSWFLMQVSIVDIATGEKCYFVANRWIAVEKQDGNLELDIDVADKKELSGFKNLFYTRTASSLGDGHLWLSVFTRPPHNTFTRAQRLGCCISILFATMITNAMFYSFGAAPGDAVQVGPMKVSLTQIKIGIQSSIVAIPVNVLVVSIFRNIKPRANGNNARDAAGEEIKGKGCLPFWFVIIAWFIAIMATLASAAFIVFYSMMWGAETSNEWLVSILISFFQDVIVMQPVKVIIVASILSVLIKKPPEQDKVLGESVAGTGGGDVTLLDQAELEKARRFKSSLVAVGRQAMEFAFFFIFIMLMMVVCYGNRGVERFAVTQSMEDLFQSFRGVYNIPSFWKWTKKIFVPRFYDVDWYNGLPFEYEEGFLSNRAAFVVGMPRMRQLRVKPEQTCTIEKNQPLLGAKFARCIPFYAPETEDATPYNRPGWLPVGNETKFYTEFELDRQCPVPWRYQIPEDLGTRPIDGLKVTYVGGGYLADLGYNSRSAMKVIRVLENDDWIDDRTVAVFIEFTIFEPSSSLFSAIKLLFERIPTGGSHTYVSIKTLSLYASPDPNKRSMFQICQLLLMIIIIVLIFAEIGKLRREKCAYFKDMWNWFELFQIISTICSLVFFFLKEMRTSQFVKKVQENPYSNSSTDFIQFLSDLETFLLSFVIFIITIKFLRLIKFNRHVCQVTGTLKRAVTKVLSFMIVFVAIIMAYTQIGYLVFSSDVGAYSSVFSSLRAMLLLLFGGEMHFDELQSTSRYIAPAFIFGYMSSMSMVLLNMFLAILNDCYNEVKHVSAGDAFGDAELGEFMAGYMKEKIDGYKVQTWEAFQTLGHNVKGIFWRTPRENVYSESSEYIAELSDEEASSVEAKLASSESLADIEGSDNDNNNDNDDDDDTNPEAYPLVELRSLHEQEFDSSSLKDIRKSFLQIGQDLRQSLSSIRSAVSYREVNSTSGVYDFKEAMVWLEEERSLNYNGPSSYFSAFGSYIEDIWQKNRRSYQHLDKALQRKRRRKLSKGEAKSLIEPGSRVRVSEG